MQISLSEIKFFTLGVLFILASGCAKYKDDNVVVRSSPADAVAAASQAHVECVDPKSCHPSVALLTSVTGNDIHLCTAFLFKPDIVLTNSHCIPNDLKAENSNCEKRMWVTFPAIDSVGEERAGCYRVLHASDIGTDPKTPRPDFAFIQLERPILERRKMELSAEGLEDGTKVSIFHVTPVRNSRPIKGRIATMSCVVKQGTYFFPSFDHPLRSLGSLGECSAEVKKGNSGSPVVNSEAKAIAILQGAIPKESIKKVAVRDRLTLPDNYSELPVVTNLACVQTECK